MHSAASPSADSDDWAQQRRVAAAEHAQRLADRQQAESDRAQAMIDQFLIAAQKAQLEPYPLMASAYGDRFKARTHLQGWYLRRDERAGIDTAGRFYLLSMPLGFFDRFRVIKPAQSAPPLVLGAGGKDGESLDMAQALTQLLPTWRD